MPSGLALKSSVKLSDRDKCDRFCWRRRHRTCSAPVRRPRSMMSQPTFRSKAGGAGGRSYRLRLTVCVMGASADTDDAVILPNWMIEWRSYATRRQRGCDRAPLSAPAFIIRSAQAAAADAWISRFQPYNLTPVSRSRNGASASCHPGRDRNRDDGNVCR